MQNWNDIRQSLISRRDELNLSNYQLAKDCNLPESTVHRILNGERVPSVVNFFQLLTGLKMKCVINSKKLTNP
jgi:predicted transcriptional regulator